MVEDSMSSKPTISEEQRRKISEGMKRAHARRKKANAGLANGQKKAPVTNGRGVGLLGRLKMMRAELDTMIKTLEAI